MGFPVKVVAALPAESKVQRLRADAPIIRIVAQAETEDVLGPDVVFGEPVKAVLGPVPGTVFVYGA